MPFDPAKPTAGAPMAAAVVHNQLNALKTLIDAVPAGPSGAQGAAGEPGPQGVPGEVSGATLNDTLGAAILGTSNVTNAVGVLGLAVSDPPTQGELQAVG